MIFSLLTSMMAIYFLRSYAVKIKLIDSPSARKPHEGNIPLIGGIVMFIGVMVSIFLSPIFLSPIDFNHLYYYLIAVLLIVIVGAIDDYRNISVSYRLIFQTIAALIVVSAGETSIESLGNILGHGEVILDKWNVLFTVLVIIAGINAVNMADGIHGLAGGNSLISFIAISFLSINSSLQYSLLVSLLFCSVLPVFLVYNLCIGVSVNKRIFMGDAGSMFIGLSLVWLLINFSQGQGRSFSPAIALWLFALPVLEITSTVFRRLISGVSPFKPDLSHTHHILLGLGFSQKNTLIFLLTFSVFMAVIGVLGEHYEIAENVMFVVFIFVFLCYLFIGSLALKKFK